MAITRRRLHSSDYAVSEQVVKPRELTVRAEIRKSKSEAQAVAGCQPPVVFGQFKHCAMHTMRHKIHTQMRFTRMRRIVQLNRFKSNFAH